MAKKNSTKTATQEALSAAEPKLQTFTKWQGINIEQTPLTWTPDHRYWSDGTMQTDLATNFLLVQNNAFQQSNGTIETRQEDVDLFNAPDGYEFTGVTYMHDKYFFAACRSKDEPDASESIFMYNLQRQTWKQVKVEFALDKEYTLQWTNIFSYTVDGKNELICQCKSEDVSKIVYQITNVAGSEDGLYYVEKEISKDEDGKSDGSLTGKNLTVSTKSEDVEKYKGIVQNESSFYVSPVSGANLRKQNQGCIFTGKFDDVINNKPIKNSEQLPDPYDCGIVDGAKTKPVTFKAIGFGSEVVNTDDLTIPETTGGNKTIATYSFMFENKFGSTKFYEPFFQCGLSVIAVEMTKSNGLHFIIDNIAPDLDITAVNIYGRYNNSLSWIYVGRVELEKTYDDVPNGDYSTGDRKGVRPDRSGWKLNSDGSYRIEFNYFGDMTEKGDEAMANLEPLNLNTTLGPVAQYGTRIDSRLYFWGNPDYPYRLYIGGSCGMELKYDNGYGGAYVDAAPDFGCYISNVLKFKTQSGADIVTILCGHNNSSKTARYNLCETTLTATSELSTQSYQLEQVSNVEGCSSRQGSLVAADGLYYITRYGLAVTTMAMEYSSQMRTQYVSSVIKPVFSDKHAHLFENACMIYIDEILYFMLSNDDDELDRIIFAYDTNSKAIWTYTVGTEDDTILKIYPHDYYKYQEGIGVVTKDKVVLIPTTDVEDWRNEVFDMQVMLETGELSSSVPTTDSTYVDQLEIRFDWFVGELEVVLEGVDYYGRHVHVSKIIREEEIKNDYIEWMKVGYILENYHVHFIGHAHFRLTHFVAKVYTYGRKFGIQYGFDANNGYKNRRGAKRYQHHQLRSYNNLKECICT